MDNYRNTEVGTTRFRSLMCDRTVVSDLSGDFTLSDYQPEIKRLLRVKATVSPADKYIGVGTAELSGTVDYAILYAGNDGALYCAEQSGEYHFSCPTEAAAEFDLSEGLSCDVETVAENVTGRVSAPRRLSVKCRLRSRVRLYGTRLLEERIGGVDESTLQRLKGNAVGTQRFVGTGEPMQLGDEILFDAEETGMRVISGEGQVFVTEAMPGSGCVNCRGEVALKLLCCRDGIMEPPTVQTRRIPFSGSVPVEGAEVNCDCTASGVCTDLRITVDTGRILCEVGVRLTAHAMRNAELSYTEDLYSTAAPGENDYESLILPCVLSCQNGNFSLNNTLSMEEVGIKAGQTVADISLLPSVSALECENGKYILSGRCRCTAVLCQEADWSVKEFEIPFRYECEGSEMAVASYDAEVTPISARARMDGERVSVDAELAVSLMTEGEREIKVFREARFGESESDRGASYTICYPSREDTLWSVAKRYRRSVADLGTMNSLPGASAADSPDSLSGIGYLLV